VNLASPDFYNVVLPAMSPKESLQRADIKKAALLGGAAWFDNL